MMRCYNRVWRRGPDPAFPLFTHENPAFRTFFHRFPETRFFVFKICTLIKKTNWLIFWIYECFTAIAKKGNSFSYLSLTNRRGKGGRNEEDERGGRVSSPLLSQPPPPRCFFLLPFLCAAPTTERLKREILALENSLWPQETTPKLLTVLFTRAELGSLFCLQYLKFNGPKYLFNLYNKCKELEQLKT